MGHSQNKPIALKQLQLPEAAHYVLAFSGGSDSTALLHALCQNTSIKPRLSALHINHQVQSNAAQWADHCQQICKGVGIPLTVKTIKTEKNDENSLRNARLQAYANHLDDIKQSHVLITGHHLNDDIETLLFRLLRGTGLNGLTGISESGLVHGHSVRRPLLQTAKPEIMQYLKGHRLTWIEDPSNADDKYDRNFIRNQIVPLLLNYRPDAIEQIQQTRNNLNASLQLLQHHIGNNNPFNIDKAMSVDLLATSLYHWLAHRKLNPANRRQLSEFAANCLTAGDDKQPILTSKDYVLITNNDRVYALKPHLLSAEIPKPIRLSISQLPFYWQHDFGQLQMIGSQVIDLTLTLAFDRQGEKIKLPGRQHHSRVKEVLRTVNIPTWERSRLPYIYNGDQLLAVGSIVSADWQTWLLQHQVQYNWHSSNYLL